MDVQFESHTIDVNFDRKEIYNYIGFSDKELSISQVAPQLATEWHPTKNGVLTADKISTGSDRKVWWLGMCGHEWEDTVSHRYAGRTCPVCSGRKIVPGINDLATLCPTIAVEWHPTKNMHLMPTSVAKNSNRKVWWLGKCGHEWEAVIATRTNGTKCPICSGRLPEKGINDFATLYPKLALEWDVERNVNSSPSDVVPGSAKHVWWKCPTCNHEYNKSVRQKIKSPLCPKCKK